MPEVSSATPPPLPTPLELREHSRRYQEAARKAEDAATKRQLAGHALALAQIAEALAHEGEALRPAKIELYNGLLAGPLSEKVRQIVEELLNKSKPRPVRSQIKAWRMRAEELRTTADGFVVPSAQDSLRRAAANYDALADQAEAVLAGCPPLPEDQAG
jgi:hypothetical protein